MGPEPSFRAGLNLEAWMIRGAMQWRGAVAGAVLILSGCSLGPVYHRPSMPPPAAWNTPKAAALPQAWPSSDWWSGFHSAELTRLMTTGRSANDDLAAAIARVRQADAQVRISSAPLLPSLDANAGGSRQRQLSPTTDSPQLFN